MCDGAHCFSSKLYSFVRRKTTTSKTKEFLPELYSSCVMVRTASAASCIASLKGFDERMQQAVKLR